MEDTAAAASNEARCWARYVTLAEIGITANGTVRRTAYSAENILARGLVAAWGREQGFAVGADCVGNLFVRRPGRVSQAPPVLIGAHLDVGRRGDRSDGAFGACVGLEILESLNDAGLVTKRPVEVVVWANADGGRYAPPCLGSATFAGLLESAQVLETRDDAGVDLVEAVAKFRAGDPDVSERPNGFPISAYIEACLEPSRVLGPSAEPDAEFDRQTVAVVLGLHETRRFVIAFDGDSERVAAAMTAAQTRLEECLRAFGRHAVIPFGPRGPLSPALAEMGDALVGGVMVDCHLSDPTQADSLAIGLRGHIQAAAAAAGVVADFRALPPAPALDFSPRIADALKEAAIRENVAFQEIALQSLCDARMLVDACAVGMLALPFHAEGLGRPEEHLRPTDIGPAIRALAEAVTMLAG